MRHPLRSAAGLFRSRWFAIGMSVAVGAWALHVAALAMAPLSLVQAVISGGLVLLAVAAERWFGFSIGPRQWLGLALSAAGLAFLAVTVEAASGNAHSSYSTSALVAFEGGTVALGILLILSPRMVERARHRHGVLLGAAAGILFGVSDVAIKALTGTVGGPLDLIAPWTGIALIASVGAFYASARGLQTGDAIPVITITSIAANASAIVAGVLVFGDPIGSGTLAIVARALAFATVIGAALVVTPAPVRAAEANARA
jgi:drug/metabolite transporter (DMT)-like permease